MEEAEVRNATAHLIGAILLHCLPIVAPFGRLDLLCSAASVTDNISPPLRQSSQSALCVAMLREKGIMRPYRDSTLTTAG